MLHDEITLFYPGDGCRENSNSATYKNIKDFMDNNNGTITFKTQKHGTITTPLPWRLKKGVENELPENHEDEAPAGNQAPPRRRW